MPERQSPHADNEIIDAMEADSAKGAQQSRSGGTVNKAVGTRAELNTAEGNLTGDMVERAVGSDNPAQDAEKGPKSAAKIRSDQDQG